MGKNGGCRAGGNTYVVCILGKGGRTRSTGRGHWGVHPSPAEDFSVLPSPEPPPAPSRPAERFAPPHRSPFHVRGPPGGPEPEPSPLKPARIPAIGRSTSGGSSPSRPPPPRGGGGPTGATAHRLSLTELSQLLQTDLNESDPTASRGLTSDEARRRLVRDGLNLVSPPWEPPALTKFGQQFLSPFMFLMAVALVLSFITFAFDRSRTTFLYSGIALSFIVVGQALLSFLEEHRGSTLMSSLRKITPSTSDVIRDGQRSSVHSADLVVGDVLQLKANDRVPADIRIIQSTGFKVDCSSFTGEPDGFEMTVHATHEETHESRSLALSTSLCTEGSAYGVVVRTGDQTLIGQLTALATSASGGRTTLQLEVRRAVHLITALAVVMALVVLIVGVSQKLPATTVMGLVATIIVANVPQGLQATVSASLSVASKRLWRRNVVVKSLEVIETLGCATCIASDKTGTLTQNKMSVQNFWLNGSFELLDGGVLVGCDPAEHGAVQPIVRWRTSPLEPLLLVAAVCNSARYAKEVESKSMAEACARAREIPGMSPSSSSSPWLAPPRRDRAGFLEIPPEMRASRVVAAPLAKQDIVGDATEAALLRYCDAVLPVEEVRHMYPRVYDAPFSAGLGFGYCVVAPPPQECPGQLYVLLKGAPEVVLDRCGHWLCGSEEKVADDDFRRQFEVAHERFAQAGERVLAFAFKMIDAGSSVSAETVPTKGFTFVGLASLLDPPKPGAGQAVLDCHKAGIRVFMVTGDHALTAEAIARKVNIVTLPTRADLARQRHVPVEEVEPDDPEIGAVVITGPELKHFNEEQWDRLLPHTEIVFARTSPQQKLQIVEHLQQRGEIVAVTGDGVNDAPALRRADIGLAMGHPSASDVAREAADMVVLDGDFRAVVAAIREGRLLFDNLKKSVVYTLSHLWPQMAPVLVAVIFLFPLGLSPLLILTIDLGSELLPAVSLAFEQPESAIMQRPPRNLHRDRLVSWQVVWYSFGVAGLLQAGVCVLAYLAVFRLSDLDLRDVLWSGREHWVAGADAFRSRGHELADIDQVHILSLCNAAYYVNLVLCQMFHFWFVRTRLTSVTDHPLCSNKLAWVAMVWQLAFLLICCYIKQLQPALVAGDGLPVWLWLVSLLFLAGIGGYTEAIKFLARLPDPHGLRRLLAHLAW